MTSLSDLIRRLSQENPEVSEILRTFTEMDRVYREIIQAAQGVETTQPAVKNSADVSISFRSILSDSTNAL